MCGVCGFYKNRIIPKALQGLDFGDATTAAATEHVHDENCGHNHDHSHDPGFKAWFAQAKLLSALSPIIQLLRLDLLSRPQSGRRASARCGGTAGS
jgi:hypothetical protein